MDGDNDSDILLHILGKRLLLTVGDDVAVDVLLPC